MVSTTKYQSLLQKIIRGFAYKPFGVDEEWQNTDRLKLVAEVDANDMGVICGKGAANLKAIQKLFEIIRRRDHMGYLGVIISPHGTRGNTRYETKPWNDEDAIDFGASMLEAAGEVVNCNLETIHGVKTLVVHPEPSVQVYDCAQTLLSSYGYMRRTRFGLKLPESVHENRAI